MDTISKALGAAVGGAPVGGGLGAVLASSLPPGSPIWAYVAVILGGTAVGALAPFLTTYISPANKKG